MVYTGVSTMYGQYVCMIMSKCMSAYVFDRGNQGQVQATSFLPFPKLKVVYSVRELVSQGVYGFYICFLSQVFL